MLSTRRKLSYVNLFFLGLFVCVSYYFLNYTPKRTFERLKCMEIYMTDTSVEQFLQHVPDEFNKRQETFRQELIATINNAPRAEVELTNNSYMDAIILDKIDRLLRTVSKSKNRNLLVRVQFNEHSSYESFVRCHNLAWLHDISCYLMLGYNFYYYNCE